MNQAPLRAGRREWIGLAVIALPCLLYSMDLTVLHLAVPKLSADLQPSSAQLLWIIDIYGFLVAGSLITMGTLGDRIGRRRLLLIGAACFGARLGARGVLDERRDADRDAARCSGSRARRSRPRRCRSSATCSSTPQQRTTAIAVWITGLLGRRGDRPAPRRRDARVLLVGLGVPPRGAGDGAAARRRARAAARVPRPERGPARRVQRGALARRGADRDLRPQADRAGRHRRAVRSLSILVWLGLAVGAFVHRQTHARRPADRPQPLPRARRSARRWRRTAWPSS